MSATETFERDLVAAIDPIRHHVLAIAIFQLFQTGLFDRLREPVAPATLARELDLDDARLTAFLTYLANEDLIALAAGGAELTARGRALASYRGWYLMLMGGYGGTFAGIGGALRRGAAPPGRDAALVGLGSCLISQYDAIPLTRRLLQHRTAPVRTIGDLGCGNAQYLVDLSRELPGVQMLGVEPDPGGVAIAIAAIAAAGFDRQIRVEHGDAMSYLRDTEALPDVVILGFVLHEVLAQSGEAALREHLTDLFHRHPDVDVVVIEVDAAGFTPTAMSHPLTRAYYNPYYLLHHFTTQRLETPGFWRELFTGCGATIVAEATTDPAIDSTGLELGFLLRGRPA